MARQLIGVKPQHGFSIDASASFADYFIYERGFATDEEATNYNLLGGKQQFADNQLTTGDAGSSITIRNLHVDFHGGSGDDNVSWTLGQTYQHYDALKPSFDGGAGDDTLTIDLSDQVIPLTMKPAVIYGEFNVGKPSYRELAGLITNFEHFNFTGGSADDEIQGGASTDRLDGGAGRDLIVGNGGKDILTGGAGGDFFKFNVGDSGIGGNNRDIINDFQTGLDKIDLTALGVGTAVKITQTASGSLLQIDADHNGSFEMQISTVGHVAETDLLFQYV
ncbi:calcium-binding protein [Novosphingobium olei]|uniref:Peptidase M10 serralysin C-terminal domain-containing protein n=1 Tax=Novosphingobium olei TaxID=2728851 RepID=A0A7Y0BP75_9SPHN|nr:M10 family metallopeptidase C-terminal domain-containing protein [Novosphingobium olei]NML93823.1 hypothetical protein [Novosphingobium olei]